MKNVILINNLFNGEYIENAVGGEIINMYQCDNDRYYVYINPYGNINKKWDNKIEYVLFTKSDANRMVKIISKAKIKKQISLNAIRKTGEGCDREQKYQFEKILSRNYNQF